MWEVQCGRAGRGSAAGPAAALAALPGACPGHSSSSSSSIQLLPAPELLTGPSQGCSFPGEVLEGRFSEQTGWQCRAASTLESPPAPAVSRGERLSTQSCCPRSRAPRLRAHLCLPTARLRMP